VKQLEEDKDLWRPVKVLSCSKPCEGKNGFLKLFWARYRKT
jgi:hypothetical protein